MHSNYAAFQALQVVNCTIGCDLVKGFCLEQDGTYLEQCVTVSLSL